MAVGRLDTQSDKGRSLTDCVILTTLKLRGLIERVAFDQSV